MVYGVGALSDTHLIRNIVGLSVFPWLKQGVNADLIKLICDSVDDENDDDLIEENTAQLLEKYMNEDDGEDEDSYNGGSGMNYSLLYDSPYDSDKDRLMLIEQLVYFYLCREDFLKTKLLN